ncbi:MAG: isopentenyl transferase family protein [Actinomycetota bacterium]|nr:isopentenyl transferase family protein [Actinomycetota bacterium]
MQGLSHDMEASSEHIKKALISKKYVVVICGPTCAGKSRVGSNLARQWKTDIISADSMQVYKEMDIGTDKQHSPDFKLYMTYLFTPDHHVTAVQFKKYAGK